MRRPAVERAPPQGWPTSNRNGWPASIGTGGRLHIGMGGRLAPESAPVLDPGRGRTKTGYFWAIARDDRPWGGTDPPGVVYTYAPGRGGEHASALLTGYAGIVQCDGYTAYKQFADPTRDGGPITLAFCWAHWRRRFFDIDQAGPAPIAHEALERIAALYAIESRIRGRSAEERHTVRQAETKPLVEDLRAWLETRLIAVSEKSTIAEAIRYGFNHWDGLVRFLEDGRIEMDTNIVERTIRPIALNRKNSLFAGHDAGAVNWACLASLIETAKLHGLDPQAYIADILGKIVNGWPMANIDALLPWAWADRHGGDRLAAGRRKPIPTRRSTKSSAATAGPVRSGLVLLFGSGSRRHDVCGRGVSATHPGNPVDSPHPKIVPQSSRQCSFVSLA